MISVASAQAQQVTSITFGLPSAPYKNQSLTRDRLDSIQGAATTSLSSSSGQTLYQRLREAADRNPQVKKAMELEFYLLSLQERISNLQAEEDVLRQNTRLTPGQIDVRLKNLEAQIETQKKQMAKSIAAKRAQFMAKAIGASLTAVSLYFQIRNIKDAIRRVKIKEADLIARKEAMLKDGAKLDVLERRYESAKTNLETVRSRTISTATELEAAEIAALDSFHELDQWRDVMKRAGQKIMDAEETAMIDERSVFRQKLSVGLTTIGVLVIGLFGDKIILSLQEWLESDDPVEQEASVLSFLKDWHKVHPKIMEASLLPSFSRPEVTPEEKSAIFFMSSAELGVKPGVLERALKRYKQLDAHHYAMLQGTAEARLKERLQERMKNAGAQIVAEQKIQEYYEGGEWRRYNQVTVRDATYVKPYPVRPLEFKPAFTR